MQNDLKPKVAAQPQALSRLVGALSLDPVVSAAWLYYEDQLTQSDIAKILGVSRATVIHYLHEAKRQGIVSIRISTEHSAAMQCGQAIQNAYGLDACIVIPDDRGRRPSAERVGQAGAQLLSSVLAPGDTLGVSWGQTVLALSKAVTRQQIPDLSVVQITGSMMATYAFSPELCTSNIADRLGGRCINLHAPALVSRPDVKELLCAEPAIKPQLKLLETCTKLIFGVGNLDPGSTIFNSGTVTYEDSGPYRAQNATAVIAGRFIDARGRPLHGSLDDRMIGLTMAQIDRIPVRICVAGGASKAQAIKAALTGGHATTLVTDEAAARALMALA